MIRTLRDACADALHLGRFGEIAAGRVAALTAVAAVDRVVVVQVAGSVIVARVHARR